MIFFLRKIEKNYWDIWKESWRIVKMKKKPIRIKVKRKNIFIIIIGNMIILK
jgi:hypothetical protein